MWIYYIIINIITFFIFGLDKLFAIKKKDRIPEFLLHIFSFLGGYLGAILGMVTFHHKTRKPMFWIWNSICIILWLFVLFEW